MATRLSAPRRADAGRLRGRRRGGGHAGVALFGDEPARLNTGAADPLAVVPQWTCLAAVVGAAVVPAAQVTALAAYAPETVEITSRL